MGIILWVLLGLVAGSAARWVMPAPNAGGVIVAMFVGVGGALVGGLIGSLWAGNVSHAVGIHSLLMAIAGSLTLLFLYRCQAMRATS